MNEQVSNEHKFKQDSEMTFEEVFAFKFGHWIPLIQNLASELDREDFIELLQKISSDSAAANAKKRAESLPKNDFEAWTYPLREQNRFLQHVLTSDVVEDSEMAFEVKVTECLWAKTFREADAAEIGYVTVCHPDFAMCQAFNPKIQMIRSKTLMQGDDCCNQRWVWED